MHLSDRQTDRQTCFYLGSYVKPLGVGRPGKGGGFDSNHRPVVRFFDRFNGLSSNILLTFSCYFDNPQCPGVGHLNGNSQLSSSAPAYARPPPPQRLNIDRCITAALLCPSEGHKHGVSIRKPYKFG